MADENTENKDEVPQKPEHAEENAATSSKGPVLPKAPSAHRPAEDAKAEDKKKEDDASDTGADSDKDADNDADAQKGEDNKDADGENKPLDHDVWGTTGDKTGDAALQILQNAGMSPEDAKAIMFDAVREGKPENIDRNALIEKIGAAKTELVLGGVRDFVTRSKAKADAVLKDVHTAVGGEDNWKAVTTWAKQNGNVPEADMAAYHTMIDAGGPQARFAASELAALYNKDSKNTTLNAKDELVGDTAAKENIKPMTRVEAFEAKQKAMRKGASAAELNAISRARALGRQQGI